MFTVRANYSETFEVQSSLEKVRGFFSDIKNFYELVPNIESIHIDSNGTMHWNIRVVIPLVGSFTEKFLVSEIVNSEERVEWRPAENENFNLMSYSTDFLPKGETTTLVQYSQNLELRRKSATDLHFLAGLAGESIISSEMTQRVSEMLSLFIQKARDILEK